ncbi:hypothetical protein P7C73_g6351, partial [Tremellales sp. Uapishka_1]
MDILYQIPPLLRSVLASLSSPSTPLLPFIPKSLKLIFLLLVIVQAPSLPFLWHLRVWRYPLRAYFDVYTKGKKRYLDDFLAQNDTNGGIGAKTIVKRLAWFDDCDYNLHLSNSCYAKSLDAARMSWAIQVLAPVFTPGPHMALGASHYVFFKEIPIGSEYTMETRAGGWGDKWFYLVTEFVIYPKKSSRSKGSKPSTTPAGPSIAIPLLEESSGSSSPSASGINTPSTAEQVKKGASLRARQPRTDGGVVCCLAVSEYCFKMGRVTIPPRIAFYVGLQSPSSEGIAHGRSLIQSKDFGRGFLRGEWKKDDETRHYGEDIGLKDVGTFKVDAMGGEEWIESGRRGMEDGVQSGLGVF